MKKTIYFLKLIDGKFFFNQSRNKLCKDLRNYIVLKNKKEDGWFYPSKTQIDNIIYKNVKNSKLFFIEFFCSCPFEDVFLEDVDIPAERENGMKYTKQYIDSRKTKIMNKRYTDYLTGKYKIDTSKFKKIELV